MTLAAGGPASTRDIPGDLAILAVHSWGALLGRDASWPRLVERQHLCAAPARARVLRPSLAQALQTLPIYALTGNPNPMLQPALPLDVRAIGPRHVPARTRADGSAAAGFVAGLAFAFAPYASPDIPHL